MTITDLERADAAGHRPPADTDQDVFAGWLVREHERDLHAYITGWTRGDRFLAEDVVQEALLRAWQHRGRLTPENGSVRGWLITVARNISIDWARARASRPTEVPDSGEYEPISEDPTEQVVNTQTVLALLDRLTPEHRSVLFQLFVQDRTMAEVSELTGVPVGTVKSRAHYALRRLRSTAEVGG